MEEKIPCIKCDSRLWEYIKSYLEEWNYHIWEIVNLKNCPLIVINADNIIGRVNNLPLSFRTINNRELVTDVEEFLERAARLKGFTYKRKDIMEKEFDVNKLEVGMIVEYKSGERRLVLSDLEGNLFLSGICNFKRTLFEFTGELEIYKVYKIKGKTYLENLLTNPNMLELIWEKPIEVELTMQEIADKFGIPVEQLKIKK